MTNTATIGHNNPPEPIDPFKAIEADILDLFELAESALTGDPITSQEQADQIDQLAKDCRKAEQAAEAARKEEKDPHDKAAAAVQAKWKPLVDKAVLAKKTALSALTPWNVAQQAIRDAEAAEARRIAEEAAEKARKAIEDANAGADLAARERAEADLKGAAQLKKVANKVAKPVATGLRTYWEAEITDAIAFGRWAWANRREEYMEFLESLAAKEARGTRGTIPGLIYHEQRKAA